MTEATSPQEAEARRQSQLLAAIWQSPALGVAGINDAPGILAPPGVSAPLRPYTSHAQAASQQVLQAAYPSIERMIGSEALGVLAWRLWQTHPPCQADLNQWGAALPDLIQSSQELAAWPHLVDCARLDWALHECTQAPDSLPDLTTLERLEDTAPGELAIHLRPDVQLITSMWPIVTLWQAHHLLEGNGDENGEGDTARRVEQALHQPQAETAVVWRDGWQARVEPLPAAMQGWMQALIPTGDEASHARPDADLQTLLAAQGDDFDVTAWLTLALSRGWLWRIALKNPSA